MQTATATDDNIRVYWMTGCTSCLRTKEFLTRHNIPFLSRNVLEDSDAYAELERFGLRQVPIVTRGEEWVNGQVLGDVARIAGIPWGGSRILPVAELRRRLEIVLDAGARFLAQLPEETLAENLPDRPRSYADLAYHVFNIADAFLEHEEQGIPLTFDSYNRIPDPGPGVKQRIQAYAEEIRARIPAWFEGPGRTRDWKARADVYYGEQTMHEFLERTTWHSCQHTRQLEWVLERKGIAPDGKLDKALFEGLPMPVEIWG
jgi:glutaredoxin